MPRAFVALRLPDAVLDAVGAQVADLATTGRAIPGVRPSTRDQWHLTLQFLGNHADVDAVIDALGGFDRPGGRVRLGGGGAFPSPRRGQVLWLGLAEGVEAVTDLARGVGERMAPLRYEPEAEPFRPHVTIARTKAPADLRAPVAMLGAEIGPAWDVVELVVFESELRREGARHIARATVALDA